MPDEIEVEAERPRNKKRISRRDQIKRELGMTEAEELEMPPCDGMYLVGYLFEVGPTAPAGMGNGPIGHAEIAAFQANTGIMLDAWECRTLRRLSQDYASESAQASALDRPIPWSDAPYAKPPIDVAAETLRQQMRKLAQLGN